jgi:hypothetical protein
MRRRILQFRPDPDEPGAWIADLECGHAQHVRHQPPFQERPWVLTAPGRARFVDAEVECPLCEEAPTGTDR